MSPLSRASRASLAKQTISKTIPALLSSDRRAAASQSRLIRPLTDIPPPPSSSSSAPTITILAADTLTTAQSYLPQKVAVLSMCSPLLPGGGILTGATSQEESLCIRSTLYPSLKEDYYRLPEEALIYSPDILVFRDDELHDLKKSEMFYVDVISAAALRLPEVEEEKYVNGKDREVMMNKIRGIIRVAASIGADVVVLGALGCGAYGNPTREVADMFKKAICGTKRRKAEGSGSIKEIVFAIKAVGAGGEKNLEVFRDVFKDHIIVR